MVSFLLDPTSHTDHCGTDYPCSSNSPLPPAGAPTSTVL
jgi:hypothetical protein